MRSKNKHSRNSLYKYYKDVPIEEFSKLKAFRENHQLKEIIYKNNPIEYYSSGSGTIAVLIFPGGAGIAEINYNRIIHLEKNFRVIAPSFMYTKNMTEYTEFIELLLEKENVSRLILLGGSGGGFLAQGVFHRIFPKIDGMILSNTYPPIPKWVKDYKKAFILLKFLPNKLLKKIMLKKLGGYFKDSDINHLTSEQQNAIMLISAHLNELINTKYDKKTILLPQYNLITNWNAEIYKPEFYSTWKGNILVIIGDKDKGFEYHERLMSQYPNIQEYVIKGAGHTAGLLKKEEYEGIIDKFLIDFI
ncbi:alpha/beta fold hydrolase [Promethearchaeum syntrophicum]|uniref:Maspardin n=1 Tax=Promethearchaeum syntrophicum TaxID=2594042 RepID=A0A5B9D6A8_9ARCH|nr:alpha/beta fold hydrolase [Candidatus Prometheoarchaeum syntrophicum]QEE14624.1 Alpha/beta hydrolase family protein [Candidatus Prometheoarchaeum syntrophicum]